MAEKMADKVCAKLGNTEKCRTAEEPLVPEVSEETKKAARQYFPAYGTNLAAARLGPERFARVVKRLQDEPEKRELVCECENVTLAEFEEIAQEDTCYYINDIRRRTRVGMGTCQGNFCALRSAGLFAKYGKHEGAAETLTRMKEFLQGRWKGVRPVLLGRTLRETEMTRALYELSFHVNGGKKE
jgi:glycerol-3-phosphate dehydrogenase